MSGRRSPNRSLARIVVLALLALAMALAPALSFAAEAHEAVDHPAAHGGDHDHAGDDAAPGGDDARVLHLVTQLGICCGHACALLPAGWSAAIQAAPAQPDARIDILAAGRRPEHPLRPPIDA